MTGCPISLYNSRAWGFCDSSGCGKGVVCIYLIYFFSFSLSLGDTSIRTKKLSERAIKPETNHPIKPRFVKVNGYTFRGSNCHSLFQACQVSKMDWSVIIRGARPRKRGTDRAK